MNLELVIANKNYSSWSMRPWVLLTAAGLPFTERQFWFDENDKLPAGITAVSPSGLVPCLLIDGVATWDSLAICETVAELSPDKALWPVDLATRRLARSMAAEMHSGFRELRSKMPMNIKMRVPPAKAMNDAVRADIARIESVWGQARATAAAASGPFLFGSFGIVDAMFAPVVMRFVTCNVPLGKSAQAYVEAMQAHPAIAAWVAAALVETGSEPGVDRYYASLL